MIRAKSTFTNLEKSIKLRKDLGQGTSKVRSSAAFTCMNPNRMRSRLPPVVVGICRARRAEVSARVLLCVDTFSWAWSSFPSTVDVGGSTLRRNATRPTTYSSPTTRKKTGIPPLPVPSSHGTQTPPMRAYASSQRAHTTPDAPVAHWSSGDVFITPPFTMAGKKNVCVGGGPPEPWLCP